MLLKNLPMLVCSLFIPCITLAQTNTVKSDTDMLIDSFFSCDAQFFQQLAKNQNTFKQFFDIATTDNVAYIPVENIQKKTKNSVKFKKTIHYKGLTITGFQNIFVETPIYGQYFYWGFILDNNLEKAKESLSNLYWLKYSPISYIANSQIYDLKNKPITWEDNPYAIDGVIPRQGTIERSIYLEKISENQSRIVCSIQGDISKDILYSIRPDIKPAYEKIEEKQQEMIKAYELKKQKENEQLQQNQQVPSNNKVIENDKKNGENI